MPRILFFSVSIGAGHDLAAQALILEMRKRYPEATIELVDTFKYINPVLNKVIKGSYMETLKFTPRVWGYLYSQAEQEDRLVDMGAILNKLLSPKLKKLVDDFQPDLLICSHAFPCGMLSTLKKQHGLNIPLIAVITDYTVHPFWFYEEVDGFIIPSELLSYYLQASGIPGEKIWPLGLPLRPQFMEKVDQTQARTQLGLRDMPTVLVMGGGLGLGSMENIVLTLADSALDLQVVAICGQNQKLQAKLEALKINRALPNQLVVQGFTDQVARYMQASDVIISKPGGLTTAEVLACQVPMLIVDPIPGQETRNADFLLNQGVAMKAANLRELNPTLQQFMNNPLRKKQVKEMTALLGKPRAAVDIVNRIERLFKVF
ncbi:MAG: glycosyltransferase [Carboxydocellales bacterium]